jgi:Tfp pilus assembly protein PilX
MNKKNQSTKVSTLVCGSRGFTLLPCIVLTGILLLMSMATLRLGHNFRTLTAGYVDRSIASEAAEAALHDAHQHLKMMDDPRSLLNSDIVYEFGSVTGDSFPSGGRMQSKSPPEYQLEMVSAYQLAGIVRITATGTGMLETTRFIAQADYAVQLCPEDATEPCERQLRQLAWREWLND